MLFSRYSSHCHIPLDHYEAMIHDYSEGRVFHNVTHFTGGVPNLKVQLPDL